MAAIPARIAEDLEVRTAQVSAAVALLDEGSTVPFIARYRKEVTGGLDDAQLRTLEERLGYLRELEERRAAVITEIAKQDKLTPELQASIFAADTKARLEDIYLPFKPKRRTKAMIARENGLEPLADALMADPSLEPAVEAEKFLGDQVADTKAALDGARAILVERFGEDADLIGTLRERMWKQGRLVTRVREARENDPAAAKFSDYFDFSESYASLPSHRTMAVLRAEKEDVIDVTLSPYAEETTEARSSGELARPLAPSEGVSARSAQPEAGVVTDYERSIAARFGIVDSGRPGDKWLGETVRWAWRTRILFRLELDMRTRIRAAAEEAAIAVFADNLRDLLLAAPAGTRATMGLDPGIRTGVKVAVVDATGKVVDTSTVYPHEPRRDWDGALATLATLAKKHSVDLIAIGNGTASRETDKLAADLLKLLPDLKMTKVMVSEAGASVYSASAYASAELPDLDVSLRGAVSIARRLQDPLAELVKIEPKSIGVGQYQHDLPEYGLSKSLDAVVEDCVNGVGVDLNTASAPLLRRVSGITESLATAIVTHRDDNGPFRTRKELAKVPRLGPKAFEQAAGFLRIRGGDDPLDVSGVHPESYPVINRILERASADIGSLIGNAGVLKSLEPAEFVDETFGLPTVTDIFAELEKPGRDPRPEFRTATFSDSVHVIADLRPGMVLEGTVTNVAAFGAFIDIGVHQDGLVHISAMSDKFVEDPRDVVRSGDVVRVKVLEVDEPRKRISLTLRLSDDAPAGAGAPAKGESGGRSGRPGGRPDGRSGGGQRGQGRGGQSKGGQGKGGPKGGKGGGRGSSAPANSAMADALRRAGLS
ncbi:uncharacterized protein FB381_3491 [Nocardioides albertanoniae]|uniref:S1 motif domain-containing protein n=1 Tax=Nocardioides albertanoniae TaxID=1175486 RepID=A0A543AAF9_9ACTN|nr:Tex family protein [Nocardioides albertanoniae]TQL69581.1 uncharacterized protein FB381_3491 [Nocardioides albertanoniae]